MKTAIIYDRVNKWGGAERVLLALHGMFPEAPLYTSVYDPSSAPWADAFPKVIPSFLNKIPYLRDKHEWLAPFIPIAFESFREGFDQYDLVISVTSEAAKGIITKPDTLHICYCLTPTRYLWSHHHEYFRGRTFKAVAKPTVKYLRYWDKIAAQRPDAMIAISIEVQKRIKKYYGRDSEVIHPPVEVDKFQLPSTKSQTPELYGSGQANSKNKTQNQKQDKYYLVVSRLVSYKKVDLVVKAFNRLGHRLVVVGTGSDESYLKSIASKNIEFAGFIQEEILIEHYKKAKAFIFPQVEDFGITAVEAQAAGVPVVAHKAGGALDTIKHGETGVFFEEQTEESLLEAVEMLEKVDFDKGKLVKNAQKFSAERFKLKFGKLVDSLLK